MKNSTTNIQELLEEIKCDKVKLEAMTRAYKEKLKSKLTSPLALTSIATAGIALARLIFKKNGLKRIGSKLHNFPMLPLAGILPTSLTVLLPRLLSAIFKKKASKKAS